MPSTCVTGNLFPDGADFDPSASFFTSLDQATYNTDCGDGYTTCATMTHTDANDGSVGYMSFSYQLPAVPNALYSFSVAIRVNNAPTVATISLGGGASGQATKLVDLSTFTVGTYQVVTLSDIPEDSYGADNVYLSIGMSTDKDVDVTFAGFVVTQQCTGPTVD
ncbi:hypothetical protein Sste5344_004020 [Sporothrix stenoceras]